MDFRDGVLHIGDVSALDLASRFGTPLYAYDAGVIRRQIERVQTAFQSLPFRPFYAMKANSNLSILELVRKKGYGCDCVSPGEIFLARQAGFTPDEIWFTCSNVSDDDLRAIGDPAIVINANSMSEIDRCIRLELPNPIALRVNPDIGAGAHKDVVTGGSGVKFGIDLAELKEARMVTEDAGHRVVGLHAHIGSGIATPAPLIESARRLLELLPEFANLHWVNFGGGLGVPYAPSETEFPIDDYAKELTLIADRLLRARDLTAILEPGRYIVAQSGVLLSRITARRVSNGVDWIGCDTGFNHLVRPSKYGAYHHIVNASHGSDGSLRESWNPDLRREEVVIAGNLCESSDVFTREPDGTRKPRAIDRAQIDDILAFCDAGAYGFSMASHYNERLLPAEVMVDGSSTRVIRTRQTYDDLLKGQL
jgi:diaminopimelate decarboxylase